MGNQIYANHAPLFLLWTCRETGVLDALFEGTNEVTTVAEKTGISERAAAIMIDALADLEYVEQRNGKYRPTERLSGLESGTPLPERGIIPHRLDILGNYIELPEIVRTGEYPAVSRAELENYVGGMAAINETAVRAAVTAAERAHPRPQWVLDVGGGIGRFGLEFAARGADVTLVDQEEVIDVVRPHLDDTSLDLVAGDALESLPNGFDLAFCGRLTVSFAPDQIKQLFENISTALEPGGTVVCMEFVRGKSDLGALFGVHMLAMSETGNTYTGEQYRSWLEGAGFVEPAIETVPGADFYAVVGRKPAL